MNKHTRILFICKDRGASRYGSFGLINSATFVADALPVHSKVVSVIDANSIDKEVHLFNPDMVIIEALWVTPTKLDEILSLEHHKHRKWVIRIHSKVPFLANEGIALEWLQGYADLLDKHPTLYIAPNSTELSEYLQWFFISSNIQCLPNLYTCKAIPVEKPSRFLHELHVGCFGAIRPLKNQLIQAMAAIMYAREHNKQLFFHINKHSEHGDSVYKNLQNLFKSEYHAYKLIEHEWMGHDMFLHVIGLMDLGMQVSYSESYNIVTADCVLQQIPVVTSKEILFVHEDCHADPNSIVSIASAMDHVLSHKDLVQRNTNIFKSGNESHLQRWIHFLEKTCKSRS